MRCAAAIRSTISPSCKGRCGGQRESAGVDAVELSSDAAGAWNAQGGVTAAATHAHRKLTITRCLPTASEPGSRPPTADRVQNFGGGEEVRRPLTLFERLIEYHGHELDSAYGRLVYQRYESDLDESGSNSN